MSLQLDDAPRRQHVFGSCQMLESEKVQVIAAWRGVHLARA
jgi:hypothetical protein